MAAATSIDATILDVSDGRLLRDGVILAHRITGGVGEWFLAAPRWAPSLPEERVEPLDGSGDLPEVFSVLLRPLLRHGVLGPIASMSSERDEWSLRDGAGEVAAHVVDEKVTIRRSGIATARYREVAITPTRLLTGQQRDFLLGAARAVNATLVDTFPSLQQRLGAPPPASPTFPLPNPRARTPPWRCSPPRCSRVTCEPSWSPICAAGPATSPMSVG
ncbi:hypothetical protein G7085_14580 [Tessaracoccus sp. HDW20]|uniref:hypothetical protein n=1 Tax=Tessaracoccus coleopterorum TaxID=2714950 RepID=UPI0018D3A853|nr:hypothetical protein [Tessaracoccus coleopterorum]NHB85428.1 hypothetical protein [Tessaracoccus coleopterorum]